MSFSLLRRSMTCLLCCAIMANWSPPPQSVLPNWCMDGSYAGSAIQSTLAPVDNLSVPPSTDSPAPLKSLHGGRRDANPSALHQRTQRSYSAFPRLTSPCRVTPSQSAHPPLQGHLLRSSPSRRRRPFPPSGPLFGYLSGLRRHRRLLPPTTRLRRQLLPPATRLRRRLLPPTTRLHRLPFIRRTRHRLHATPHPTADHIWISALRILTSI